MNSDRVIGCHTGKDRGPLLIALGGMHGNEPAGVRALEQFFTLLEIEPSINPEFSFCGRFVGLRGNLKALRRERRFIEKDLNRQWTPENVARIRRTPRQDLENEDLELLEVLECIEEQIRDYQPAKMVLLDLHTTTATGGIFSIPTDDPESVRIAVELHAPVIKGLLRGIRGTTLHYFNTENMGVRTVSVTFEAGQHDDELSVNRALAAITNCMRTIGCVQAQHVENRHDELLKEYSQNLPKIAELIMTHPIRPGDQFRMLPNYHNFQHVDQGEVLAVDQHGKIKAPEEGCILMPLYQEQGDDGFFLIRPLEFF